MKNGGNSVSKGDNGSPHSAKIGCECGGELDNGGVSE